MIFAGIKYAIHNILSDVAARTLVPPIVSRLDFELTLQRAILTLVTILAFLLGDSTVNRNTVVYVVECFIFHALVNAMLRHQWPKDNIYLSLKRTDVDLRTKLVLSCSTTPLVLIIRILFSAATKRLPVILSSCKDITLSILKTVVRCVTLLVFGPPRLLYAILRGLCSSALSPFIWIAKGLIQLVPSMVGGSNKLLSACLEMNTQAFRITSSFGRTLALRALQLADSIVVSISKPAVKFCLRTSIIASGAEGVISSGISSAGTQVTSLLPIVIRRTRYLSGSVLRLLEYTTVCVVHVVTVVIYLALDIAMETAKDVISRIHFFCLIIWKLCRLPYSVAGLFIRLLCRVTLPSTGFFFPDPSKAKVLPGIKVFGVTFIAILCVLVLYYSVLNISRCNVENATLIMPRYEEASKGQQSRDSQPNTKSDGDSLLAPIKQHAICTRASIKETHMKKMNSVTTRFAAAAAQNSIPQGGLSSQLSATKHSPQRNRKPDSSALAVANNGQPTSTQTIAEETPYRRGYSVAVYCAAAAAPDFIAFRVLRGSAEEQSSQMTTKPNIGSLTAMHDQNPYIQGFNQTNDLKKDFSLAAYCAAATAPKFIACEGLRRTASEVREVYEAQITGLEAKIHVLEEGASGVLIGHRPDCERKNDNINEPHFHPSYAFYLARGLETARLDMALGEADVRDAARSWAVDRARYIYNIQKSVGIRPVFERLYDGDLNLIDFLDLEPTSLGAISPLLLPSSSCRGEVEAELQDMELVLKVAERDLDLEVDDVDREIGNDIEGMPQSPTLYARRALLQVRSAKREEKRVTNMTMRRKLVREGMKLFKEGVVTSECL